MYEKTCVVNEFCIVMVIRLRKFFIFFSIIFIIVFFHGAVDAMEKNQAIKVLKNETIQKKQAEINRKKQNDLLVQRKNSLKNIEPIFQNVTAYDDYQCQGALLKGSYAKKACKMFNFMMVNNAYNDIKTDINNLRELGYDCDFDYQKAKEDFKYQKYLGLEYHDNLIDDLNYQYPNKDNIVLNKKPTFTLNEALADGLPVMLWMVPANNGNIAKGHLITLYQYHKNHYYFYDTFNKDLKRDFNEFIQRWKIAEVHIYKK